MGEQPQRDRKQAPLSLLKIVFPQIFGEHCAIAPIALCLPSRDSHNLFTS